VRIAKMIKVYCAATDLTAKELAQQTGINESTLSRFFSDGSISASGLAALIKWMLEE
jgi:DNA-binding Xre family transcriptional regulator